MSFIANTKMPGQNSPTNPSFRTGDPLSCINRSEIYLIDGASDFSWHENYWCGINLMCISGFTSNHATHDCVCKELRNVDARSIEQVPWISWTMMDADILFSFQSAFPSLYSVLSLLIFINYFRNWNYRIQNAQTQHTHTCSHNFH